MNYLKGFLRTALPLLPLFSVYVLVQIAWGWASDTTVTTKILVSLGIFGGLLLVAWVRWKVWGPPVEVDEVKAHFGVYLREADGDRAAGMERERLRLVVPVREAEGRLPYWMLRTGYYLALTDRTVTAFTYDRAGADAVAPLWAADSGTASVRDGRVVVPDGEGGERSVVVPVGLRGDVEYWMHA